MSWDERTVIHMRTEFVIRALSHEKSKAALCREYGITRRTGDKWIKRYILGEAMNDKSRAPKNHGRRVDPKIEELIVATRNKYPAIGATKIREILLNEGKENLPSAKTFNNIFHRHGLITKEASENSTPNQSFQKENPNDMWQADFKGHFTLGNGEICHPLNILDDRSRFNLCCEALRSETFEETKPIMERLFRTYGLPFSFLCDNGNPWGTAQSTGFTKFEVWLMELGILTIHGRIRHPQTQGKEEKFNQSLKKECLKYNCFHDIPSAQVGFNEYREFYNNIRPHHSLNLKVPSSVYQPSRKNYPSKVEDWEYGSEYKLIKVKDTGYITINGQGYFLSESFGGKTIAVRESSLPGQLTLVFRQFRIGRIDPEKRVFTLKRAYLLNGDPRSEKK